MTRQDIPCVYLGGKFVSLDSKTEARQGGSRKKQAEKILATAVMGMNLVNTVAPLAVLAASEQKMSVVPQPVRSEAEPLDYAMLPQLADVVDRAIFARAYATDYDGNASVADMAAGDKQTITAGQSGTVSTMSGGQQDISSGGTGTVSTMNNGGSQFVDDGGTGAVSTMSGGKQKMYAGTGTIGTMSGGSQAVYEGGTAIVDKMLAGEQSIEYGGTGTVSIMSGGTQKVWMGGTGTVITMSSGVQTIHSGGTGAITMMSDGWQEISGGTGTVSTLSGGRQNAYSGGNATVSTMMNGVQSVKEDAMGTVSTMSGGVQSISSGGTGIVSTMSGGEQSVSSGGTGTVGVMLAGKQFVDVGGMGTVSIMSGGSQSIVEHGSGTISTMSGGGQTVYSGGTGTINTMNSGLQWLLSSGTCTIDVMHDGMQDIRSGGTGTIDTMNAGSQFISSGGSGTVSTMSGGTQVMSGGTGTINTMNSGLQWLLSSGTCTIDVMHDGMQDIRSGGTGTIDTMNAGSQFIASGGTGTVDIMSGGSQTIVSGAAGTINTMHDGMQAISSGCTGTVSAMNGGTQAVNSGGTALDTVIAGGTQLVSVGAVISGATLSAGVQQVYDGTNLNNITFAGGTQAVMSGAAVSGMQVANGVQSVASGGSVADTVVGTDGSLQLSSGGIVSSLTLTSGSLELENINGGNFTVSGTLTANNATVDMTDSSIKRVVPSVAHETLTIDKLSGSGTTFIMDTDLAGETNSDKITITDADAGTHYVQIKDLSKLNGVEVTGAHQQLLITDASGKLTFEGKEFNAGGLWDVDPTLAQGDSLGLSANDWYLTKLEKTANNDTRVLLDAADNSYALWRNTNDSLRSRLGALASGSEQSDGIWARTQAGRFSGDNYEGRYNLYQLGFDQAADAKSVYGAAVDYGDGTGSYDNGSGKDKLKSFSLYGVWTGANGAYTNVTARYGMVSTDLESYGDYPDKAEYKQHAYSVSVEYGKRIALDKNWFIEPNAQFTLGRLGSIDYTTDRGANGYIEGMNSAIGRIGFVMGQKITGDSDIYLKADLLHEFAGERDLQLTSDAGGTNDMLAKHNDYGDTWFELGLGANIKVSKTASIYGELERGFGGDINKKWSVNGGVRFTF